MKYTELGKSGITVSKICAGGMSFGKPGTMHDWTLNGEDTEKVVKAALDLGINFFDTANCYSQGTSEEYLGRALKRNVDRHKVVIASKVYFNPGRLSREAIAREIDGTLSRLGTDYLDLYIIHRFDYETPVEETIEALDALVRAGKVRALGASAMYGYQFFRMQTVARENGWAMFQAMENHYNLLYREDERELIPICREMNVSLMPYSPLAGGHLTRPQWESSTLRGRTDLVARGKYDHAREQDMRIVRRVAGLAEKYGVKMAQIALAWEWARGVASPIVGATKASYLEDAAHALDLTLAQEDVAYLEEAYLPHKIIGAIDHNPEQGAVLLDAVKKEKGTVTLNNGVEMPRLGLGVFQVTDQDLCRNTVREALGMGYRLIDTAACYGNERAVGDAVRESGVDRGDVFLCSKVWIQDAGYEKTLLSFAKTLENLQTDYLDLYLIHMPYGDYHGSWRAMEELYRKGKVRAIGVCNFLPNRLEDLILSHDIVPAVNQIELHPFSQRKELRELMRRNQIVPMAWAPFAEGLNGIFTRDDLSAIGKKHGKTPAQVVLRWLIQSGAIAIPKSVHAERLHENLSVTDFALDDEDMDAIGRMDTGRSLILDLSDPAEVDRLHGIRFIQ